MGSALTSAIVVIALIGAVVHEQMHSESERNKPFHLGGSALLPPVREVQNPLPNKPQLAPEKTSEDTPKKTRPSRRKATLPA